MTENPPLAPGAQIGAKRELKLMALDAEDLAVVSAHLQDAIAKIADIAFLPKEKRFAMVVNRFDWVAAGAEGACLRRRCGFHLERVFGARVRGLDLKAGETMMNLLAIEFEERQSPSGTVTLYFSGDAAIQLDVECLEAALTDLGPCWSAHKRPSHAEI